MNGLDPWLDPLPLPELWLPPAPTHSFDPAWLPLRTHYLDSQQVESMQGPSEWNGVVTQAPGS